MNGISSEQSDDFLLFRPGPAMARIWRATFHVERSQIDVLVLDADQVEAAEVSQFSQLAQQALQMNHCRCEENWPFEDILGMNEFLDQLGHHGWGSGHATYLTHKKFHAVGLGSDSSGSLVMFSLFIGR